jgi:hypothetical protein
MTEPPVKYYDGSLPDCTILILMDGKGIGKEFKEYNKRVNKIIRKRIPLECYNQDTNWSL